MSTYLSDEDEKRRSSSVSSSDKHSTDKRLGYSTHVVEARYSDAEVFNGRFGWFWRVSYWIDSFGEARGVDRQPPEARGKGDLRQFMKLTLIWLGATGSLSSMTGFFIGCLSYNLSFKDSMSAGICGAFVGSLLGAFGAVNGPKSGLRQMISTRFQFGWWPAKFIALLNVLTLLGWSVISLVFGGELLHSINSNIPLDVGIVIMMVISVLVAVFGINYMLLFDKVFVFPTLIVVLLTYICTGSKWAPNSASVGDSQDIIAAWLSFFSASVGVTSTWIAVASDYFVDLPETIPPVKVYSYAVCVMLFPTLFLGITGIGISSAARFAQDSWMEAYTDRGTGGLLAAALDRWNGGGKFMVVVLFISLITNNIINTYSIPLSSQTFGRIWTKIPRYILSIVTGVIYLVLALAGRNKLAVILENFLPMIAYWSVIYAVILILETLVFRRHIQNKHQFDHWNDKDHFPVMWAAVFAFCCGVVGCILGMSQVYYTGVIARKIGSEGADIGVFLAMGFTAITYLPARFLEIHLRNDQRLRP